MPRSRKSKLAIAAILSALLVLASLRVYFAIVPRGAPFSPWTLARVDGPVLTSGDGNRTVSVYFNDAGAMHSGNHWTWVVEDCWLWGRRVVAEGYLGPEVAVGGEPVPLEWGTNNEIRVRFLLEWGTNNEIRVRFLPGRYQADAAPAGAASRPLAGERPAGDNPPSDQTFDGRR